MSATELDYLDCPACASPLVSEPAARHLVTRADVHRVSCRECRCRVPIAVVGGIARVSGDPVAAESRFGEGRPS